ncbi:MAG TPA: NAD(P)-dependent oxidoreductase [Candidatus Paceibacterota bacterium]
MNILFLYKEEWEKDYIGNKFAGHNLFFQKNFEETPQDVLDSAEILSVFVSHKCKTEEMAKMPNLKLVAARSTGFDYVDIPLARSRGVEVVYVPSYGENTVAEFAFALLLALSRKIPEAHEQVTETGSFVQGALRGFDLAQKTIGIIGTGRIGINSIKIAKGFGMEVVAYDPFPKQNLDQELGFRYVGFEELLGASDIISLHAPFSEHTKHMINENSIYHIKRGATLINTARGGLVQTSALVRALEEGIISAAGLDVLEEEGDMSDEMRLLDDPHPKLDELKNVLANNYLINHPRVIVTPHIAFNTEEAVKRILDTTVENIISFARGEVKNRVP